MSSNSRGAPQSTSDLAMSKQYRPRGRLPQAFSSDLPRLPSTATLPVLRRLHREAKDLSSYPPPGIRGGPTDENMMQWNAVIIGPENTPFAGGRFKLVMTFPNGYPFSPPSAKFLSKIFHPNIDVDGNVCVDILRNRWEPALTARTVLLSIQSLLDDPNPSDPVSFEAANFYLNNREEYIRRVRSTVEDSWLDLDTENAPLVSQIAASRNARAISPSPQPVSAEGSSQLFPVAQIFFENPDPANITQTQTSQAVFSSNSAPLISSLQAGRPDRITSSRSPRPLPVPARAWSNGDGNARPVSPPGSDDAAYELHDPRDRATQDTEEEEASHNLETLMATREPLDLTGQVVIPDYRFPAHGGLAMVYQGLWGDDMVAIKVLKFRRYGRAGISWDESNERRVRREINVWAALQHRNIIEFLGYSTDFAEFPAMISPWCKLGTASEYLGGQELTTHERIRLAQGVSEGIQYLHQLRVVHGDVKPANILVSDEGVAKLCDFGLVRLADWEGPVGMTTTSPYTGTERYKAPELFVSPENRWPVATFEGDIYSLGSIMLEFIERLYPFQRFTNSRELRIAIADGYSPALRSESTHVLSDMTEFLWNLLEACWDESSARPSIRMVVDALGTFAQFQPPPGLTTTNPR